MVQNIVAGFVVVALIIMGLLAYVQQHEGCLHGRSVQTLKPCGSVSATMSRWRPQPKALYDV
jgi:hypothetical protein